MTTGKTVALTRWTFVGKVMSQLFDMLSGLVITFLPRSKRLLISQVQSPSAVELFQILKDDAMKVLNSICQQIWKTQQWPQDWKRSVFIPIPKKGNAKESSNYHTIAIISHTSKVMLKILQFFNST